MFSHNIMKQEAIIHDSKVTQSPLQELKIQKQRNLTILRSMLQVRKFHN